MVTLEYRQGREYVADFPSFNPSVFGCITGVVASTFTPDGFGMRCERSPSSIRPKPLVYSTPSKHAGSDPEAFWLRPVTTITASVQPEWGRIVHAGCDSVPFFQRRPGLYCAKPALTRSGWPFCGRKATLQRQLAVQYI